MVDHDLPILSAREKQLLRRIAKGKSNQQIAFEIGGTEQQIGDQRRKLLFKLGIRPEQTVAEVANRLAPWPSNQKSS